MGAAGVPEWVGVTVSRYVPPRIKTVSPGCAMVAACWIVRNGAARVPGFVSRPVVETNQLALMSMRDSSVSTAARRATAPRRTRRAKSDDKRRPFPVAFRWGISFSLCWPYLLIGRCDGLCELARVIGGFSIFHMPPPRPPAAVGDGDTVPIVRSPNPD